MTLDQFLPPTMVKPKKDSIHIVEEKCSRCKQKLSPKEPKYILRIKGKENTYCQGCAKAILRPQENTEEPKVTPETCVNAQTVWRKNNE